MLVNGVLKHSLTCKTKTYSSVYIATFSQRRGMLTWNRDLKVESAIMKKCCWYLSSTANQITSLPPVLPKQCVDWLELFMAFFECIHRMDSQRTRVAIHWIWLEVYWIWIVDPTFNRLQREEWKTSTMMYYVNYRSCHYRATGVTSYRQKVFMNFPSSQQYVINLTLRC